VRHDRLQVVEKRGRPAPNLVQPRRLTRLHLTGAGVERMIEQRPGHQDRQVGLLLGRDLERLLAQVGAR